MKQHRKDSGSRPGWRGPGSTKASKTSRKPEAKKPIESRSTETSSTEEQRVSIELQQHLLNIFRSTFPALTGEGADSVKPVLQEIKQALFERDFDRAFGRKDYLEAYAFRWSPSRSLCYLSILTDLLDHLNGSLLLSLTKDATRLNEDGESAGYNGSKPTPSVVCLGGGAAEVVAFGGLLRFLTSNSNPAQADQINEGSPATEAPVDIELSEDPPAPSLNMLLIDTAAWGSVIESLTTALTTPPPLSKYASASARASNTALLPPGRLSTAFQRQNLLTMNASQFQESLGHHQTLPQPQQPILVTLLFTLNELYSSSITATTAFLLSLTAAVAPGTLLLVVDSPGSYSEAVLGKERKRYPMQWLMDRTLLGGQEARPEEEEVGQMWQKLEGDESRWFRLPEELKYPISLESMRYQMHLFRRL